jgi:hypothetical protein
VISECGRYRYLLDREWPAPLSPVGHVQLNALFVMLNPSTADAVLDDPTVRRCIAFAKTWGYSTLTVCNLFALRATSPRDLRAHPDPVGPENDNYIYHRSAVADLIVAAWGAHGGYLNRSEKVLDVLARNGPVFKLGLTASGEPRHPLYVPGKTVPSRLR